MVRAILTDAGFIEGKTFKETRFLKPPDTTYAIYLDSFESSGADDKNFIKKHNCSIEVYSKTPARIAEITIERAFDVRGIEYAKDDRLWLQDENLYMVVYRFDFMEK